MAAAAASRSDGHVRKRQFQPSITSYFSNDSAEAYGEARLQRCISSLSPPLPEDTQASLLSVGMRVRKSVPEGYKTHKTLGATDLPFPSTAPSYSPSLTRASSSNGSTRELMPFCGLHKTGGWAMQELPPSSAPAALGSIDHERSVEEMPGLSSTQSTLNSIRDSLSQEPTGRNGSRKRTYEEEVEDELDAFFEEIESVETMQQISVPSQRQIARLKSTASKPANAQANTQSVLSGDFEDAVFLAPMDMD